MNNLENDLLQLVDPSVGKTLQETEGLKHISIDEEKSLVTLIIGMVDNSKEYEVPFKRLIAKIVKIDYGYRGLKIQIEESDFYSSIVSKKGVRFIGIASGKGGTGKSMLAVNIAERLAKKGFKVGLLDADIYGSSIPTMLNISEEDLRNSENKTTPFITRNIQVMSTEFFTEANQPIIWRGGMLNSLINHYFYKVKWDKDTSFMIIDLPSGTGDVMLDIKTIIPKMKVLLVTDPSSASGHVAIKAGKACESMGFEVLGLVENMSYIKNGDELIYSKGKGGGIDASRILGCEFIAQLQEKHPENHDYIYDITEPNGKVIDEITDYIIYKTTK